MRATFPRVLMTMTIAVLACGLAGLARATDDTPWQDAPPAHSTTPDSPPDAAPPAAGDTAPAAAPAAGQDAAAPADDADTNTKCLVTGLPWKACSTRVTAVFKVDGQRLRGHFAGLPFMLIEYKLLQNEHHDVSIDQVSVLDYPSFGTSGERMIPINDDWSNVVFIHTDQKLAGSKGPYFAAFSDADDLDQAKKDLGGKVMTYKAVLESLFKALDAEDEPKSK